jgi:DNA-binding NtrC family response regulator
MTPDELDLIRSWDKRCGDNEGVISDLRMTPMGGLDLLKELKSRWPEVSVIILTAHGTIPEAVQATQCVADHRQRSGGCDRLVDCSHCHTMQHRSRSAGFLMQSIFIERCHRRV